MESNNINSIIEKISKTELSGCPSFIAKQFLDLAIMYKDEDYYGCLFQIKDCFEILLKYPIIVLLAGTNNYILKNSLEEEYTNCALIKKIKAFISKKPTLGDWVGMGQSMSSKKHEVTILTPVIAEHSSYLIFQKNLNTIVDAFQHPKLYSSDYSWSTVTNWRNITIGHGATSCNVLAVKENVEKNITLLYEVLQKIDYSSLNVEYDNENILISSCNDRLVKINLSPYINIASDMFDVYDGGNETAITLNYCTGANRRSNEIYQELRKLQGILSVRNFSNNAISDQESLLSDVTQFEELTCRNIVPNDYFESVYSQVLAYPKGIFLIKAERGTGKTTFANMLEGKQNIQGPAQKKLTKIKSRINGNDPDLFVWCYKVNSVYSTSIESFFLSLFRSWSGLFYFQSDLCLAELKIRKIPKHYSATDIQKDFADYLNKILQALCKYYNISKLLIVIDGIDELQVAIGESFEFTKLFKSEYLDDNIYVVFQSRTDNECSVNGILSENLNFDASFAMEGRRTEGKYLASLDNYINTFFGHVNYIDTTIKNKILDFCDYRFIYIDTLRLINEYNPSYFNDFFNTGGNKYPFIYYYLFSISKKNKKHRDMLLKILMTLAIVNCPLTLSELHYLCTFSEEISVDFLALLYDIKFFLSSDEGEILANGKQYTLSNVRWQTELEHTCFEYIRTAIYDRMHNHIDDIVEKLKKSQYINENVRISKHDSLILDIFSNDYKVELFNIYWSLDRIVKHTSNSVAKNHYTKFVLNVLAADRTNYSNLLISYLLLPDYYAGKMADTDLFCNYFTGYYQCVLRDRLEEKNKYYISDLYYIVIVLEYINKFESGMPSNPLDQFGPNILLNGDIDRRISLEYFNELFNLNLTFTELYQTIDMRLKGEENEKYDVRVQYLHNTIKSIFYLLPPNKRIDNLLNHHLTEFANKSTACKLFNQESTADLILALDYFDFENKLVVRDENRQFCYFLGFCYAIEYIIEKRRSEISLETCTMLLDKLKDNILPAFHQIYYPDDVIRKKVFYKILNIFFNAEMNFTTIPSKFYGLASEILSKLRYNTKQDIRSYFDILYNFCINHLHESYSKVIFQEINYVYSGCLHAKEEYAEEERVLDELLKFYSEDKGNNIVTKIKISQIFNYYEQNKVTAMENTIAEISKIPSAMADFIDKIHLSRRNSRYLQLLNFALTYAGSIENSIQYTKLLKEKLECLKDTENYDAAYNLFKKFPAERYDSEIFAEYNSISSSIKNKSNNLMYYLDALNLSRKAISATCDEINTYYNAVFKAIETDRAILPFCEQISLNRLKASLNEDYSNFLKINQQYDLALNNINSAIDISVQLLEHFKKRYSTDEEYYDYYNDEEYYSYYDIDEYKQILISLYEQRIELNSILGNETVADESKMFILKKELEEQHIDDLEIPF